MNTATNQPLQHLLVIIDQGQENQPALEQALSWSKDLLKQNIQTSITAVMPVYNYASEINTMLRGTVLHNLRRDLIESSENWLEHYVGQQVELAAYNTDSFKLTVNKQVIWGKKTARIVHDVIQSQNATDRPFTMVFKSIPADEHMKIPFMQAEEWLLVRNSSIPVMLVRQVQQTTTNWLLAVDPNNSEHDGVNDTLVNTAQQYQQQLGGELQLINAYLPPSALITPLLSEYGMGEYMLEYDLDQKKERVETFLADHQLSVDQMTAKCGAVEDIVNEAAARTPGSTIVVGSRAHAGFADRLVGHAAEKIIQHAKTNVLIIKHQDPED